MVNNIKNFHTCCRYNFSTKSTKPNEDWLEGKQLINILIDIITGNFVSFGTIGISRSVYVKMYKSKRNEIRKQAYNMKLT